MPWAFGSRPVPLVPGPRWVQAAVWARGARHRPSSRRRGWVAPGLALQASGILEPGQPSASAGFRGRGGAVRHEEAQALGARGCHVVGGRRGMGATSGAHWCLVTPEPGILGLLWGCRAGSGGCTWTEAFVHAVLCGALSPDFTAGGGYRPLGR